MAKFEESIKELEEIVKLLEEGEPISLIKACQKDLESADVKIKELTEDGAIKPFNEGNT